MQSLSASLLILSKNCTWMESLTTRLSPAWHSWSFQKCTSICLTWSWALHCHAVNGSRVPSQRSRRFASILPTAQDCTIADYYTMKPTHSLPRTPNLKCRSLQLIEVCTLTRRRRRRLQTAFYEGRWKSFYLAHLFCHFSTVQLKRTWSNVSPKLRLHCRSIVDFGLPASHEPCTFLPRRQQICVLS